MIPTGLVSALSFALLFSACRDLPASPQEGLAPGHFEVSVRGDRNFSRTGDAVVANVNHRLVAIIMGTHPLGGLDPDTTVNLDMENPPGLTVGVYPVSDFESADGAAGGVFIMNIHTGWSFHSIGGSGTIEITRKTNTGVEGRFSFLAAGAAIQADPVTDFDTIRVSGRFNARY